MGFWDTLCVHCAVAPSGGPRWFTDDGELVDEASTMTAAIIESGICSQPEEELKPIVHAALKAAYATDFPEGLGYEEYADTFIAVGYWREGGIPLFYRYVARWRIPDGRRAEVRRLRDSDGYGAKFNTIVTVDDDGKEKTRREHTYCDPPESPCIFVCERCFYCLDKWLDLGEHGPLPPRSCGFPNDPEPLPLAAELYEIVNVYSGTRRNFNSLLEGVIDYDGVEKSLEQCQDHLYPGCWRNPNHLARAIEDGLRGEELVPAIMRDVRAWVFMRPDIWPEPPSPITTPHFTEYALTPHSGTPALGALPPELLLPLLASLPLLSLLNLSATCRALRRQLTDPAFLDQVLKQALTRGSLQWLAPLERMPGDEVVRAHGAMRRWLPEGCRAAEGDPLAHPAFPRLAFVRACWDSDSMMNRKRLWGQVRQFEALWREYRLHGWKEDYFFDSREVETYADGDDMPARWRIDPNETDSSESGESEEEDGEEEGDGETQESENDNNDGGDDSGEDGADLVMNALTFMAEEDDITSGADSELEATNSQPR